MLNKQTYLKTAQNVAKNIEIDTNIKDCEDLGGILTFTLSASLRNKDEQYLQKELSKKFNQKVNIKTVDPRQKAAKIGGIGPCGMRLCCKRWLNQPLEPQGEEMQNEQIMFTNSSCEGACGELLCCLCYAKGASNCSQPNQDKNQNKESPEEKKKPIEEIENKKQEQSKMGSSEKPKKSTTKKIRRLKL